MKPTLSAPAAFTLLLTLSQSACGNSKYEAVDLSLDDNPSLMVHFSAADATSSSPVVMTVPGRQLTIDDGKYRVRLQRRWVALRVPKESSLVGMGSALCELKRKGEFPHCDVMIIELAGTEKPVEYYFYLGNWPPFYK